MDRDGKHSEDEPRPISGETDATPLRVPGSTGISHTFRRPTEQLLVIRPVRFFPILGGFIGLALTLVGAGLSFKSEHPAGWFVGGIGTLVAVACCLIALSGRRYEFDREAAEVRVRRFGSVRRYPQDRIRAVQLIHGGWYGGDNRPKFNTYQLNLMLDDSNRPRMNLTNTANWPATWSMASALADFLGLPLQDDVSED